MREVRSNVLKKEPSVGNKLRIRMLKRWILRQFSRQARPYLKSYGLLQTVKYKRAIVGHPGGGRVLVLAPHMDDEVIGCGGTVCKHVQHGADVTVVFITDGRTGSKELLNFSGVERRERETELAATRKCEADEALRVLGVQHAVFWGAEETTLTAAHDLPARLAQLLKSLRPDVVYLPFFLEEHVDHRAVSQVLMEAVAGTDLDFDCAGYEVWTPLFPNYLVEIGDVIAIKQQALEKYQSQLADLDYVHTALGLNAYRSSALLETRGYAEAFFYASRKEYLDLYRSFCGLSEKDERKKLILLARG
jgi:LmbE family N-acetylglucosaminyl deacetylase